MGPRGPPSHIAARQRLSNDFDVRVRTKLTIIVPTYNMRNLTSLALMLLLTACVPHSEPPRAPAYRPPLTHRPPAAHPNADVGRCETSLANAGARFAILQDTSFGGSCNAYGVVQLSQIAPGIPVTNTKALRCETALPLTRWFDGPVQSAAQRWFGSRVVKLESMGTYACRNVVGNAAYSAKLSEHAHANAVDIGGFDLADGRRVTVLSGWHGADDEKGFLHEIHDAACHNFVTVLSPDYNAAHANHLHFDMGGNSYCR